jgi:hypothetical protein
MQGRRNVFSLAAMLAATMMAPSAHGGHEILLYNLPRESSPTLHRARYGQKTGSQHHRRSQPKRRKLARQAGIHTGRASTRLRGRG